MKKIFVMCMLLCAAAAMQAKVDLPPIFADNMVLQQQSDAAIWGKAAPGAKVVITTTWAKGKTTVQAGEDGKWFARVATPKAGGPYEITVNDGDKVTLKNVLIGEVWICSGQSNMFQPMKGYSAQPTAGGVDLILDAKPSTPIRSCNVKKVVAIEPQDECECTWYGPETACRIFPAARSSTSGYFSSNLER